MHLRDQLEIRSGRVVASCVAVFFALLAAFYSELFYETCSLERDGIAIGLQAGAFGATDMLRLALMACCFFIVVFALLKRPAIIHRFVRFRFVIGAAIVVLCVAFSLSGSSVAYWSNVTGGTPLDGTLFGFPRSIRSDELRVLTPFAFSQAATGFQAISPVLRGGGTDVSMIYASPAWTPSILFRPFLWGYLALGAERGLSFFWAGRLVVLFLVTFQFSMLLSGEDERLSLVGALLVTFAPIVQWWFAVNGTAELFIFGQGLVLSLDALLGARDRGRWWLYSALMAWLMGCYLLIIYPSWQVPLFYVFLGFGVWLVARSVRECGFHEFAKRQLRPAALPFVVSTAAVTALLGYCFWLSWDTILTVMGTAYPGARSEVGGGLLQILPNITTNLAAPIEADLMQSNACEAATFFALFPCGLALGTWCWARTRDGAILAMLAVYAFLGLYGLVGLPSFVAHLFLLSNVQTGRLPLALGYLDVMLIMRSLSFMKRHQAEHAASQASSRVPLQVALSVVAAVLLGLVYVLVGRHVNTGAMRLSICAVTFGIVSAFALGVLLPNVEEGRGGIATMKSNLLLCSALFVTLAGCFVNPVQQGAGALTSNDVVDAVSEVHALDPSAVWVADDSWGGQLLAANGVAAINTVNAYPKLDLWRSIDSSGKYDEVYNRYALIDVVPSEDGDKTWFELGRPDFFTVHVVPDDVESLGVCYWLSKLDLTKYDTEKTVFVPVRRAGPYTVYQIEFLPRD